MKCLLSACVAAGLSVVAAVPLVAQQPLFRLQPSARPGQPLQALLLDRAGLPFATFVDVAGEPQPLLGETLWLGLTPSLTLLDAGLLDAIGMRALSLSTPNDPALVGHPLFAQALVADAASRNGLFRASNGESTVLRDAPLAIVHRFDDPAAEGFTGTFDLRVRDRLHGGRISRRLVAMTGAGGAPFNQPIATPLMPFGSRAQMVYRAADLQARAVPEYVTALHWRPFGPVTADRFPRIAIELGHSDIVPDYRVDPFSALPMFPDSGLGRVFASNYKKSPVVVYDGPYAIDPRDVRSDGWLPYPMSRPFEYDGFDSLVVELKVPPSNAHGMNGATVSVMVLSSPRPDARAFANGTASAPLDPFRTQQGDRADNAFHHLQVELTDVHSVAISPWVQNPQGAAARWEVPHVAASVPAGTRYHIEFQGARDPLGNGATPWFVGTSHVVGYTWVRYRVSFNGDPVTGAVPSIDTLVIPVR